MTDPLEVLQAETARKLVVSLREELATEKQRHLTFIAEHNFDALTALRSELAEAKAAEERFEKLAAVATKIAQNLSVESTRLHQELTEAKAALEFGRTK